MCYYGYTTDTLKTVEMIWVDEAEEESKRQVLDSHYVYIGT